jgi:hypothetical protein
MKTALGYICKAETTRLLCRYGLASPLAVLLGLTLGLSTARADTIFVTDVRAGSIGEYTTSGATVNPALISGLSIPEGIAVSGSDLFVVNFGTGTIGEYTTSGATVNPALISGLNNPVGIAVSGSDLFVTNFTAGTIGEYTTSGATVNPALISGLNNPVGIAVSGSDLFVANGGAGAIGEYTTSGATVNPALISGLLQPEGIAIAPTVAAEPSSFLLLVSGGLAMVMISIIRSARRMALARATKGEAD